MLAFRIALRFLRASKGQTILITLGIAIGVSVQVFIGLLIQGLQDDLIDTTIGNASQVTILAREESQALKDPESLESILRAEENIRVISPVVEGPGFAVKDEEAKPIVMRGFNFDKAEGIYEFSDRLTEGELPVKEGQILLGSILAEELAIRVGDDLTLTRPTGNEQTFEVSGIADFKVSQLNESWVLGTMEGMMAILDLEGPSKIEMQLYDIFASSALVERLNSQLDGDYVIEDWQVLNEDLLGGLRGQSVSSYMIQVAVLAAVLLGIASTLAITVIQKSRQIGILKAMGLNNSRARNIFLFEGMLLGTMGAVLGVLLGIGLILSFTTFALNADGSPVVPVVFNWTFIFLSGGIAILAAVGASLLPARKSGKLSPIEVIKNG